ncbi:extracellular solute-binding protein [Blautia schinkii]|nr:extracellular solute-binding protein [Blautia schinkii]
MKRKALTVMLAGLLAAGSMSYGTIVHAKEVKDEEVSNAEDEQITLEFINGSAEEQYVAWLDEVIANFEEANPNIKIEIQKTSIDSFNQTVMTRFAAGDVPDLFSFSANDMDDMVPSGYVLDLSGSANLENYSEGMLDSFTKDGKTYALPIANDFMCVTYNKAAFETAGIGEVPDTWTGFLDACKKLQEAGIVPIASGFSEQWVVNGTSQTTYCAQVLANDGPTLASMVDRTNKFADTEQWKAFFTKLQEIYPYMNQDPFGTDQNTCYSMLANGDAGMILNGTWTVTNATAMNPDAEFGIFALPVSENAEDNVMPMCPPESAVAVAAESPHAEEAVKFLEYMMSPDSASLYAEKGAGIPIVKGVDTANLTGAFKDAADIMNSGEVKVISSKSFPSANEDAFINDVSEFFLDGCEDVDGALEILDTDFDNLAQ